MSEVTASLVVQFRNEAAGMLQAEIDSRPGGYNGGRTSFQPGDSPAFLVYRSANVGIYDIEVSAGNIAELAPVLVDVVDFLSFPKTDEATLSRPYYAGMTAKWLGNNLGSPTLVGDSKLRIPAAGVGVLKVAYKAHALAFRFAGLPSVLNGEAEYQVLAVITGEAL
jgi:hypothetical protein